MLVADPSSHCDICFQSFSERRECYSIPCGHVFCLECLERLPQRICPMCRKPLNKNRIRKVHVDMSKSLEQDPQTLRNLEMLEEALVSEVLSGRKLSAQNATDFSEKIRRFLRGQPSNQYALLRSIEALLKQYASTVSSSYEKISVALALKASYEDRIKQLEHQLKAKTRKMETLRRAENDAEKFGERVSPTVNLSRAPPRPRIASDLKVSAWVSKISNHH